MKFNKFVNNLSEIDYESLYKACLIRLADGKTVIVENDIIEVWKINKSDAILELRERFPSIGLSELKQKIYNRLKELKSKS